MKKVSTAAGKTAKNFQGHKLTIGLDLGDRSSWYCVLDEAGEVLLEQRVGHNSESHAGSVRRDAAEPDCVGDRNAFAVGKPIAE
jgi:predicted NBD/HSP70 family sugar kinase